MANYEVGDYVFDLKRFFPDPIFSAITEVRVNSPEVILQEATARKKRKKLTRDGMLTILAADHPGRMVTRSGDDPVGMCDRQEYLGRVLRVVTNPDVDGIMATTDVIEDLFIVNHLVKQGGGPSFLDEKVMLGSMNRGGLSGTAFEMDDTFTSFSVESLRLLRLDAAKTMFRLELTSGNSAKTMLYNADIISELNRYEIPCFLEILYVSAEGYKVQKSSAEMMKAIGVASAMGDSSRNLWLKIPFCENYSQVVKTTTLPLLMLGGESKGDPTETIGEFVAGLKAGANVRGALVGRNILFPGKDDPLATALAVNRVVHASVSTEEAVGLLMNNRDIQMDALTRYIR
jgi:DhnA family fructose-bisphosphate aldolase class Ia